MPGIETSTARPSSEIATAKAANCFSAGRSSQTCSKSFWVWRKVSWVLRAACCWTCICLAATYVASAWARRSFAGIMMNRYAPIPIPSASTVSSPSGQSPRAARRGIGENEKSSRVIPSPLKRGMVGHRQGEDHLTGGFLSDRFVRRLGPARLACPRRAPSRRRLHSVVGQHHFPELALALQAVYERGQVRQRAHGPVQQNSGLLKVQRDRTNGHPWRHRFFQVAQESGPGEDPILSQLIRELDV